MKRPSVAFVALVGLIACAAPDFRGAAAETPEKPSDDAVVARIGETTYTLADFQKRLERLRVPHRQPTQRRVAAPGRGGLPPVAPAPAARPRRLHRRPPLRAP